METPYGRERFSVKKRITSTMEDYLKVIIDLDSVQKGARVRDIANKLGVKMPTVSRMLKKLDEQGLVIHRKYENVELTGAGIRVGREMQRRRRILLRFLIDILNIDTETANEEACKMEHLLGPDIYDSLNDIMDFVESCPRNGYKWPVLFKAYRQNGCRTYCQQHGNI